MRAGQGSHVECPRHQHLQGQSSTQQGTKHTETRVPECGVHVASEGGGGGPYEGVGGHAEAQGGACGGGGDDLGHGTGDDDVDEGARHHHGNHDEAQEEQRVSEALKLG